MVSQPRPVHFIDISLAGNQQAEQIAELLGAIPGIADPVTVMRRCLGDLEKWIGTDCDKAQHVATYLNSLAGTALLPEPHFGPEPYFLDDNFTLARQGTYGSLEDAFSELREWLRKHAIP